MGENRKKIAEIRELKQDLEQHYDQFKALRKAGDDEAALKQFNQTLKVASDLMEASTRLLKGVSAPATALVDEQDRKLTGNGKMLYIPKSEHVH